MELTSQYTSTSVGTLPQDTRADAVQSALAQRGQPRMFAESDTPLQFAVGRDDQQHYATKDEAQSREERGGVLGACAKSEFRECRGGDALKDGSTSYVKFDQNDRPETQGNEGKGLCEGIVRDAMRRIDRNAGIPGGTADLPTAVRSMITDMKSSHKADAKQFYNNIESFQDNPTNLGLTNYRLSSTSFFNADGLTPRTGRIDGLMSSMRNMPPGGLALIHASIQPAEAMEPPINGHALMVQRLPEEAGAHGSSAPARYAIFDPNNGVFTYENQDRMETALRQYMDSAFSEIGDGAAPDSVSFFSPPNSGNWAALPQTLTVPAPDRMLPEPNLSVPPHIELKRGASSTN